MAPRAVRPAVLGVAGAAALIGAVTVLARVTGFGRILVFSRTVGQTCLGDTYQTVNTIPNIVFEIVAGGALASLVVPLLSRAVADGDRDRAAAITSALLSWTVLLLAPLALGLAVFAHPITELLLADKGCPGAVDVGASMLRVFAPQVLLYGIGIVLTGVLQAHRRFGGPAVAPLLSSVVVIAAYVLFAVLSPAGTDVDTLDTAGELSLSAGTTAGVVVLAGSLIVPLSRLGLRVRPSLRFPVGVSGRARRLAGAGVAALAAQQVSVAVALRLSNGSGVPDGITTVFIYAQTLYLLPWAVLAVPIATAVFPRLADRWDADDRPAYGVLLSSATRAIVVTSLLAAAVLIAAAEPIARIIVQAAPGRPSVAPLAAGVAAFAPGLIGYGLFAVLSRGLYARGEARSTALACVLGWFAVVLADVVLAPLLPAADRVTALALGNSIGMTVIGLALLAVLLRRDGAAGLRPVGRSLLGALIAAAVATVVGRVVAEGMVSALAAHSIAASVLSSAVIAVSVCLTFAAVLFATSRADVRDAVRLGRRRGGGEGRHA